MHVSELPHGNVIMTGDTIPPLRLLRQALGSHQSVKPFNWLVDLHRSLPGWSKAEFRVSGFCAVPTSDSLASSL